MSAQTEQINGAPTALFKSFAWVEQKDRANTGRYTMLSNIRDLACGTSVVLAMVERQQLDSERGDAPIIDAADAMRLTRMSIAAMNVIEEMVDAHFEEMQDEATAARRVAARNGGA
jgi:cytidylate kinase